MEFDYIVVGAGSAGCVLANRLSAAGHDVALLEAGPRDWYPWIHIPVGYFRTMGNPMTDWCYHTQPDPGLNGRAIKWPRGRVLGGSSSINGLLYVRGQGQDYDDWAAAGNEGWSWDDVMPLFKRSETWNGAANPLRGTNGGLQVEESQLSREIVDRWIDAGVTAGYPRNPDYNADDQEGVAPFQMTMHKGLRCSSAKAFLKPIRARKNLHIITHAVTRRLHWKDGAVVGVEASIRGKPQTVLARRETILCAGAIGSPQILMLSGIGDAQQLGDANIDVRHHLVGMGRNLQDHLQARPVYRCTPSTINIEVSSLWRQALIAMRFALTRGGPMTMAASLGTGFLATEHSPGRPDIQFHIQPFSADSPELGPHPFSAFTSSVLQMRPESRGHLLLDPHHPEGAPIIHPNYLSEEIDQKTIVAGIKVGREICRQSPLNALITGEHGPLSEIADEDEAGLLDWARSFSTTIYHPTGTCKMGTGSDAVVDARLRVQGVPGVRVADCSIMPQIVSGNTNAPAIMIGEKAADLLLEDA